MFAGKYGLQVVTTLSLLRGSNFKIEPEEIVRTPTSLLLLADWDLHCYFLRVFFSNTGNTWFITLHLNPVLLVRRLLQQGICGKKLFFVNELVTLHIYLFSVVQTMG